MTEDDGVRGEAVAAKNEGYRGGRESGDGGVADAAADDKDHARDRAESFSSAGSAFGMFNSPKTAGQSDSRQRQSYVEGRPSSSAHQHEPDAATPNPPPPAAGSNDAFPPPPPAADAKGAPPPLAADKTDGEDDAAAAAQQHDQEASAAQTTCYLS